MASDITIWKSTDGIWTNAASWTNGVPTVAKIARFDNLSQKDVSGAAVAPTCLRLEVTENYAGSIGSQGSMLALEVVNSVVAKGTGGLYLNIAATVHPWLVINSYNERAETWLNGNVSRVAVLSGRVTLKSDADVDYSTYVIGPNSYVTAEADAADANKLGIEVLVAYGGTLINRKAFGADVRFNCLGGVVENVALFTLDDVLTVNGGRFVYKPKSAPVTTFAPTMILLNGRVDFSQSAYDVYATRAIIGEDCDFIGKLWHTTGAVYNCQQPIDLRNEWPVYEEIP